MNKIVDIGNNRRDKFLYLVYDGKSDLFRLGSSVKEPQPEQLKLICSCELAPVYGEASKTCDSLMNTLWPYHVEGGRLNLNTHAWLAVRSFIEGVGLDATPGQTNEAYKAFLKLTKMPNDAATLLDCVPKDTYILDVLESYWEADTEMEIKDWITNKSQRN